MNLEKLLRPHLLKLKPYASARDDFSGHARIYLDANENAWGSPAGNSWNRYPDPYQAALREKISALKGVPAEQIFLGNGSDEAIDLLIRAFCIPGTDHLITMPPTYGMYGVSAEINGVENVQVPLTGEYGINLRAVLSALNEHTKLIFICSPNNPTGNAMDPDAIEAIIRTTEGLVIIDEAYIDYSAKGSFLSRLAQFPNLVVLHTLSKAWGMAALRLGMAFAGREIIAVLNRIKPPYNIPGPVQEMVAEALDKEGEMKETVRKTLGQRDELKEMLLKDKKVQKVFPSDANFLLVRINRAHEIYRELIRREIIVRDRSKVLLCEDCLRITVGTPEENRALTEALAGIPDL
jgi:histidinol-phosphate aminotransferase